MWPCLTRRQHDLTDKIRPVCTQAVTKQHNLFSFSYLFITFFLVMCSIGLYILITHTHLHRYHQFPFFSPFRFMQYISFQTGISKDVIFISPYMQLQLLSFSCSRANTRSNAGDKLGQLELHCECSLLTKSATHLGLFRNQEEGPKDREPLMLRLLLSSCQERDHQPLHFHWEETGSTSWMCTTGIGRQRELESGAHEIPLLRPKGCFCLNKPVITLEAEGFPQLFDLCKLI